ncbi:MAG: single-stranded DNA-binding protein [Patescibacteria group bacterium]|jgi:single-strand DNA-binding protein
MNLNKAMIIGNLTRDPEVRTTPSGQTVATFGVATNLVWTDANGQKQQKVEFHNVVAWRKLGEICGTWLKKGKQVYIEGRLQTRDWVGQDGVRKYRTEIIADNMIMLGSAGGSGASQGGNAGQSAGSYSSAAPSAPSTESIPTIDIDQDVPSNIMPSQSINAGYPSEADDDDEVRVDSIPF